jgi:hypothetical protein
VTCTGRPSSYATETCVLPSGRSQGTSPPRRSSGEAARERVGQHERQRQALGRLRGRVAEHDALVAGALLADRVRGRVDAASDLPGLAGDVLHHLHAEALKAVAGSS